MKKILVHAHVFYPELWTELADCIANIVDYDFDLIVTLVKNNPEMEENIFSRFAAAKVLYVENLGFDVAPFLYVLGQIDLHNYSYVIKLHSKRDIPKEFFFDTRTGSYWREHLLSFLSSKEKFKTTISNLESHAEIAMHGPNVYLIKSTRDEKRAHRGVEAFLKKQGLPLLPYYFVAGSIFMCKAEYLAEILKLNMDFNSFEEPDCTHEGFQLAHLFERLFGYYIYYQQKRIADCSLSILWSKYQLALIVCSEKLKKCLYTIRVTRSNHLMIRILGIPIFRKKLK